MPCISEKTNMMTAWNTFLNSLANSGIYLGAGSLLIVGGVIAMGAAATGEGVTLGGATPAAGPVFAGGMGLAGSGLVSGANGLSHGSQAYTDYQNYLVYKQAYEDCMVAQIKFLPSTPTIDTPN